MSKAKTMQGLQEGHLLVLTYNASTGASYSLSNGTPVHAKLGKELTRDVSTLDASSQWEQADMFIAPNEDGLFPGMSQTWSLIQ